MNRCSIPEEETTNALRALYHPAASVPAPASENQQIQPNYSVVTSVGMASVDARYPDQEHHTVAAHTATISGKKKPGSMKAANSNDYDGSTQSSNSRKKNPATSGKLSNLNSGNLSPSPDGCEYQHMRESSSGLEKYNDIKKEKKSLVNSSDKGESPSSSASDIDNLNHQAASDKAALAKVVGSPLVSGSHIITSRSRSGFLRILNFAQDVNFAMEASRKSRIAFTAATSRLGETSHKEGISSLRKALDFNFQDVEGLLRLVRVAMEAINR
ncbi:UNVERIFIED_CONTAM: hypothetical protein Sradi_0292700 [Sesamum radiatum]|uniref:CWZF3/5/7 THD domain-containing protein n=1 Tax=Sesamum radiatum TaxID=300843 RepID=A0AAW2W3A4_SESRA